MTKKFYQLTDVEKSEYKRLVNEGQTMTYSIYHVLSEWLTRDMYFRFSDRVSIYDVAIEYSDIETDIYPEY